MKDTPEPVKAQFFATIKGGVVQGICEAYPPHELDDNQIALTREEFDILQAVGHKLDRAVEIIGYIKAKIKANGS